MLTSGGGTARMGEKVSEGQKVYFCGKPVQKEKEMILPVDDLKGKVRAGLSARRKKGKKIM